MKTSEETGEIFPALIAVQSQVDNIAKTGRNSHTKSDYAKNDKLLEVLRPACIENGIAILQVPTADIEKGTVTVTLRLVHKSGEWVEPSPLTLPVDRQGGPQGVGSAITYACRYQLLPFFAIAPTDDDDGERAMGRGNRQRQQPKVGGVQSGRGADPHRGQRQGPPQQRQQPEPASSGDGSTQLTPAQRASVRKKIDELSAVDDKDEAQMRQLAWCRLLALCEFDIERARKSLRKLTSHGDFDGHDNIDDVSAEVREGKQASLLQVVYGKVKEKYNETFPPDEPEPENPEEAEKAVRSAARKAGVPIDAVREDILRRTSVAEWHDNLWMVGYSLLDSVLKTAADASEEGEEEAA